MLKIIETLRETKNIDKLASQLALNFYYHPTLPLVGVKYDQIDSPKGDAIVREARGLVLELGSFNLVAKGFNRFFNYGEFAEEFKTFNFSNHTASVKEDGSLILLYHYENQWHVNTSGSFPGDNKIHSFNVGWIDLFWQLAKDKIKLNELNTSCTYVFEMCSLYNKVVRMYSEPALYLLSIFQNTTDDSLEWSEQTVDAVAEQHNIKRPQRWHLTSADATKELLQKLNHNDPTFEGLVLRDNNNLRYKWKTDSYLALHGKFSNGNLFLPDRLVDVARSGDIDEVVTYFPEAKDALFKVSDILTKNYKALWDIWVASKHLDNRKDFAVNVMAHKNPAGSLLFRMHDKFVVKKGVDGSQLQPENYFKSIWTDIPGKKMVEMYSELKQAI